MTPPVAVRRFWLMLWSLALGLIFVLLFATMRDRSFDPAALRYFTMETLERGRQFTTEVRVAATIKSLLSLGVMLGLCFHPLGARFLARLERLGRGRLWLELAAVATGVTLVTELVELPFSYYLGHVHEAAYGLTRQTGTQWLMDHLSGLGLHMLLSLVLWIPLYWMIRRWPRRWWAPAALMNIAFSGLMVMAAPLLLMPFEGQMVPVRDPQVLAMVQRLADRAGVQVEKVNEVLVSKKTSRVNAMVTGMGATKQIIVYDTLLQQFKPAEVEVVMAHELSHAIHRDVAVSWLFSGAVDTATLFAVAWVLRGMVQAGALRLPAPHAARGLAFVLLLTSLMGTVIEPVHNYLSREMEVRADSFALHVTGNPQAFVSGFRKLAAGNPGDVDPPAVVEFLSHSHPSIMNRLRAAAEHRP